MNDSEWYVYIVRASDQTLYTGITTDLDRRLAEHQSGKGGAKYFRGRDALEMVFTESKHKMRWRWCLQSLNIPAVPQVRERQRLKSSPDIKS